MPDIKTHKDLEVYQMAMEYVTEVYSLTADFPSDEKFGLTSQLRRAAVSLPSNIAEGAARNSTKEFIQFLYVALGSLTEIETQLEISERLGYIRNAKRPLERGSDIRKKLLNLIAALKRKVRG